MHRAMLITGFFTEAEMAELMRAIRSIEQRHPEVDYQCAMVNASAGDNNILDNVEKMRRMFPTQEGKTPHFYSKPIDTDKWEEI